MDKDETLRAKYGTRRPFTVPDDYFAQFADALMEQIQTTDAASRPSVRAVRQSLWQRLSPLVAAACMVGIVVLVGLGVHRLSLKPSLTATTSTTQQELKTEPYDDLDRMADYTMLDDDDVYAYLSSE